MIIRCCLLSLVLLFSVSGAAHARPDSVDLFVEAVMTQDTATLEKLLAANYLHVNGNGYLQDKENFIANLKNGAMRINRLTITDVTASHYGAATLLTGTVILHGVFHPQLPSGLQRMTMVLERKGNEEKVLLFQATPVKPQAEKALGGKIKPTPKP